MHYYIDGYNLLFRLLKAGDEVRKQREQITVDIEKMVSLLDLDVTLVFDSHYQEDENIKSHFKSLEIIFTAKGESADDFILQELKESKSPAQHTVVTSDKKLARLCQLCLGNTESVNEFLSWINKRYKNKLRQKRQPVTPPPLIKRIQAPKKIEPTLPKTRDSAENCFNFYLEIFEREMQVFEAQKTPPSKLQKELKKIKVKKRKITKEEEYLSDAERWQKVFENNTIDDSNNFVF
jgi:predicted RNA-binding protein with PIN domain